MTIEGTRKSKIPTLMILSDDCEVHIGQIIEDEKIVDPGIPYRVHEGEWVEIIPVVTVGGIAAISQMQAGIGQSGQVGQAFSQLCEHLSRKIVAWNWTDLFGDPYPDPYRNPQALHDLSTDEIVWLVNAITNRETEAERKNGSRALPITS